MWGPPCQGISGFNCFSHYQVPLEDPKNRQMVVFMDIVDYHEPKYVLMQNVVGIMKFHGGYLGRYAFESCSSHELTGKIGYDGSSVLWLSTVSDACNFMGSSFY